jgi:hypothetical protein
MTTTSVRKTTQKPVLVCSLRKTQLPGKIGIRNLSLSRTGFSAASVILPFLLFFHSACGAQNSITPGVFLVEPPTLICLGFEWYVEGDDNHDANVSVVYRQKGETEWKKALPLLRIGREKAGTPEWNYTTPNMFAGSILDLKEDTQYECRFEMNDPDGVKGVRETTITVKTRKVPVESSEGRIRHVYPYGYSGPKEEPAYNGLLHAYYGYPRYADWVLTTDPVQPGDIIAVHAGLYKADYREYRDYHGVTFDGTYSLTQDGSAAKPIVIKAAGDGEVVFDGNSAHNLFDLMGADYHILDGLTIRNTDYGIIAGKMNLTGCTGLTVRNCRFEDVGIGIHGVYEGSRNYTFCDNVFIGREEPTALIKTRGVNKAGQINQMVRSFYAVKVYGQGHVVCHNRVRYFFDGIDLCTHAGPESDPQKKAVSIDIYNNDIFLCNDDFIEADGGSHNIRIFQNRCFNAAQTAFSCQPVLGGPVYWIRNIGFNTPYGGACVRRES